jgi:uncharacterized membrane protein YfcA
LRLAEFIFAVIAVTGGAYVRGYGGFGSGLLWSSSLSIVLPPAQVVPIVFMLDLAASAQLLPKVWGDIHWRSLRWLLLGAGVAIPAGIYVLARAGAAPIRIAIAVVVLSATALLWRGLALKRIPGAGAALATGALCGLLGGAMGMSGPPAILFYFSSPAPVTIARASIIAFFAGGDVVGIAAGAAHELVTTAVLVKTALLLPAALIGNALGNRQFIRADPQTFRRIVLLMLVALSVAVFVRALLP